MNGPNITFFLVVEEYAGACIAYIDRHVCMVAQVDRKTATSGRVYHAAHALRQTCRPDVQINRFAPIIQ
jgi:hypothetical protein